MAETVSPITRQVSKENLQTLTPARDIHLGDVEDCLIYDRHGISIPFKQLYQDGKSVIIFVRVWEKSLFGFSLLIMRDRLSCLKLRIITRCWSLVVLVFYEASKVGNRWAQHGWTEEHLIWALMEVEIWRGHHDYRWNVDRDARWELKMLCHLPLCYS